MFDFWGDVWVFLTGGIGLFGDDLVEGGKDIFVVEGETSTKEGIKDHTEREEVGAMIDGFVADLFGRHKGGCTA